VSIHYVIGITDKGKLEVVSVSEDQKTLSISTVGPYEVYFAFGNQADIHDVRNNHVKKTKTVKHFPNTLEQHPAADENDADWWKTGREPKFNIK